MASRGPRYERGLWEREITVGPMPLGHQKSNLGGEVGGMRLVTLQGPPPGPYHPTQVLKWIYAEIWHLRRIKIDEHVREINNRRQPSTPDAQYKGEKYSMPIRHLTMLNGEGLSLDFSGINYCQ